MNRPFQYITLLLGVLCFASPISAQQNKLTAQEIVQRAIDKAGGDALLDTIHSVEMISQIVTASNDTLSFAVKRMGFNKYSISTLSLSHENSTTIYNNGNAVLIKDNNAHKITDPRTLEDLKLQCYISTDYGYKKLGYKLTRHDDQQFKNFDCYVVTAESPSGKRLINYYDKNTGNCIMTMFDTLSKAVFINFYESRSITRPSQILMISNNNQLTQSALTKINYDNTLDANWFNIPNEGSFIAPDIFKTGTFKYINANEGSIVKREGKRQVETADNFRREYNIEWSSSNDYLLSRLKDPGKPPTNENIEYIKVRIINWQGKKFYCQYITEANIGGTCAFEKTE